MLRDISSRIHLIIDIYTQITEVIYIPCWAQLTTEAC